MEQLSFDKVGSLSELVDALPILTFIADSDLRVLDLNATASKGLDTSRREVRGKQIGEVLNCNHWNGVSGGCGRSEPCRECLVRNLLRQAIAERQAIADRRVCGGSTKGELCRNGHSIEVFLQVTAAPFEHEGRALAFLLMQDVTELTQLRKLLPVCVDCGSVRNDAAYLEGVRAYLNMKAELDWAHPICPACRAKLHPGHDA